METNNQSGSSAQSTPISILRNFNLPLDTVWKAWTDPQAFKKWWGPRDFSCTECKIDFREGGKCVANMRSKDGKETWGVNTYKQIVPRKKIVMTDSFSDSQGNIIPASEAGMKGEWPREMLITLEFESKDDKSTLSLKHEGIPAEMYDDCVKGWEESLDKLEKNLK